MDRTTTEPRLLRGYRVELIPEEGGGFTALLPELPGCVAWGDSANEALENLDGSREAWIAGRALGGFAIPRPMAEEDASGRVTLRLPRSLHAEVVRLARRDAVSLNTYITRELSARAALAQVAGRAKQASPEISFEPGSSASSDTFQPGLGAGVDGGGNRAGIVIACSRSATTPDVDDSDVWAAVG